LLLSRRQVGQVLRGTKTQVRLPAKTATRFTVDRSYPVRSESLKCRVLCHEVRTCELGAITVKDALAEGHRDTGEFKDWWVRRHDRRWLESHEDEDILERFDSYHAARAVLVVRFSLDTTERPRMLMALGARGGDELGYTENPGRAVRDEPECVDETFQKWISADAYDRSMGLPGRREEALRKRGKTLSTRLSQAVRVADPESMEVAASLERINTEIARLEQIRGKKAA
jgi:hypothetical protein